MLRFLFVCTTGTCRGVMACAMFEKIIAEAGVQDVAVSFAGIAARAGEKPVPGAVSAMKKRGIDIQNRLSQPLSAALLRESDYVICLSQTHYHSLQPSVEPTKLFMLSRDIADPAGGDAETCERCAFEIAGCLPELYLKRVAVRAVPMEREHIGEIVRLEQSCFTHPWSEQDLTAELTNPTARFFAAVKNGRVVGYVGANNICGEVYITDIAVDQDYRHRGAAMVLMNRLVSASRRENAQFITLEVRRSNINAVNFYKRCGFVSQGIRPGFYSSPDEDALILTKKLQ